LVKEIWTFHDRFDLKAELGISVLEASTKGYPSIMDESMYFVAYDRGTLIGYTTSIMIAEGIYLVGNTWVNDDFRGLGIHSALLQSRNNLLKKMGAKQIYTLLNPQGDTKYEQLRHVVENLGYERTAWYKMKGVPMKMKLHIAVTSLDIWRKNL